MKSALIGFTGFVGGTLLRQTAFDDLYNSKNITTMVGKEYDTVVCAGVRAEKWKANKDPETDLTGIQSLMNCLDHISVKHFVLISTVDVYGNPQMVDETSVPAKEGLHPYGRNRLLLEEYCQSKFDTSIIRLPGLFGQGLKKNIIFDFLHNNNVQNIHQDGVFQFYDLEWLWGDVQKVKENHIKMINMATEPVSVREVAQSGFGIECTNTQTGVPARYDVQSIFADQWGGSSGYLYNKNTVLTALARFVQVERERLQNLENISSL